MTAFEPVTRQTVTEQVRAQLMERITSGELAPGTALPSERALSEDFKVARTSVREALQGLISLGFVHRRGNRVHVDERLPTVTVGTAEADARKEFVRQLFETRRVLELPIAELACTRATPKQRREILELSTRFWTGMALDEFRRLDRLFHTTIAAACGNSLLVELYGKVVDALFRSDEFHSLLSDEVNRERVQHLVGQAGAAHAEIAQAIMSGDPVAVLAASEQHLDHVEQRMLEELV